MLPRAALMVVFILITLEIGLTWIDPLQLRSIHQMSVILQTRTTGQSDTYQLTPGLYRFDGWSATVNPDGTRYTPGTGDDDLALFGDSVAWGWGVNDDQTFAAHLARAWSPVRITNYAVPGYNSANVLARIQQTTFDAALYLIYSNDADSGFTVGGNTVSGDYRYPGFHLPGVSVLWTYVRYGGQFTFTWWPRLYQPTPEPDRFWSDLDVLAQIEGLTLLAFDDAFGRAVAERYPVMLIPPFTERISRVDDHPNAAGHRQIAASLSYLFKDFPCPS